MITPVPDALNLSLNTDKTLFKEVFKQAEKTYKTLHKKGSYSAEDIQEYAGLIEATNEVFQVALKKGVKDKDVPRKMKQALDEDVFVFSALKTHAQLFEASRMLTDNEGGVKSFNAFSRDVERIKKGYNQQYLQAEYQFAQSSAQQAANWAAIEENDDRYNLQYRTAADDRVRDSHAILHNITLPPSDKFWNEYYPPNGWRCRCRAIEVLKDKYAPSESAYAIEKGEKATSLIGKDGKNRLEIFRFNPGKQKVIFPPNHPYQPKGCGGDVSSLTGVTDFYLSADNGRCKVKNEAKKMFDEKKAAERKKSRTETRLFYDAIIESGKTIDIPVSAQYLEKLTVSRTNIKTLVSKPHDYYFEKNEAVKDLSKLLNNSNYIGWAKDEEIDGVKKHPFVNHWQYYEVNINDKKAFICIKATVGNEFIPYSIENIEDLTKIPNLKKNEKPPV